MNCLLKRNHITVSSKVYYKHMGLHVHYFDSTSKYTSEILVSDVKMY